MDNNIDIVNKLDECLRILKSKGITKGMVAKKMSISPGHLSRMISGKEPITEKNIERFNALFNEWTTLNLPRSIPAPSEADNFKIEEPLASYKSLDYYIELADQQDQTIKDLRKLIASQEKYIAELESKLNIKSKASTSRSA